jgi:5'-nucleotidase/UDP-sugar diphosphatase
VIANSPYQFEDIDYMFDNPGNYSLGDITSDAFIYAVKQAEGEDYVPVDAAVVPMGTIRATINKGDITVADAFKVLSLGTGPDGLSGYPLISVYLYGWELKNVCEVDASISSMMGDAQLFLSGINYTYNPNRLIFNKVTDAVLIREDGNTEAIEPDKLYRVVCGIYSGQMLSYVKSKSFGIVSLTPKDKDGNEITDYNNQIIYADRNGQKQEVKEWQAVAWYLKSFGTDGTGSIPAVYAQAQQRKAENSSIDIFSGLNTFAMIVYAVIAVLLALIVFIIVKIIKRIRRRHKKRAPERA